MFAIVERLERMPSMRKPLMNKKQISIFLFLAAFLSNCTPKGSGNDTNQTAILTGILSSTTVKTSVASELSSVSKSNYDENTFGLVTSTQVKSWIDNWQNNKPAGITGNLIIVLFYPTGTYTKQYLKPATGVLVFDWTSSVYSSTDRFAYRANRYNGLLKDPNALPTGAITDEVLQTFGIDPTKDLIVFAAGSDRGAGTAASPKGNVYFNTGRSLYWLRSWGVAKENLAILNGAIDANNDFTSTYLSTDSSVLSTPTKGTFSVKQLRATDNSILVQPLENIIAFAKNPNSHGVAGVGVPFIADARYNTSNSAAATNSEYIGTPAANTTGPSAGALFAGHVKTARFTPWPTVIDQTTGKFKPKAQIDALWADTSTWYSGNASGDGVKSTNTIVSYCRTNARSMVSGLSAFLISGHPVVFYENSMIEWTALSGNHPTSSLRTLPSGHIFATDTAELTESTPGNGPVFNTAGNISQYSVFEINTSATTTKLNIDEDKAYKLQ